MASTYLTRTISSGADVTAFTISVWVKRSGLGSTQRIFSNDTTDSKDMYFRFGGDDTIQCYHRRTDSENVFSCNTNAVFRDTSGWYHIVMTVDSTESTASDRFKLYVNGVSQTFSGTPTYPDASEICNFLNSGEKNDIGYYRTGSSEYFDGSMSHFHLIQGTAYQASTFGSTDSATGEWKINPSPSVTYGANGFFILKDGNSVTDQSGNSNNFTVGGGTLTNTEDNPSHIFATWYADSFDKGNQVSFSNGNTTTADAGGTSDYDPKAWTTLAANAGKYYCEMKLTAFTTNRSYRAGVWFTEGNFSSESNNNSFSGVKYTTTGNGVTIRSFGSDVQSGLTSFSAGDILGVAVDIDNGTIQYYRNGSTYGSQITGLSSNFSGKSMMFCHTGEAGAGRTFTVDANFGNGYFGTTAISSEGTNASGIGKFEYDVPTGFTALSTKGLNE